MENVYTEVERIIEMAISQSESDLKTLPLSDDLNYFKVLNNLEINNYSLDVFENILSTFISYFISKNWSSRKTSELGIHLSRRLMFFKTKSQSSRLLANLSPSLVKLTNSINIYPISIGAWDVLSIPDGPIFVFRFHNCFVAISKIYDVKRKNDYGNYQPPKCGVA